MTTTFSTALIASLYEVITCHWTWEQLAKSHCFSYGNINSFFTQRTTFNPDSKIDSTQRQINRLHTCITILNFDYSRVFVQVAGEPFAFKFSQPLIIAKITWIAAVAIPLHWVPEPIRGYKVAFEKTTPYLLLISEIGITLLALITDTKGALLTIACTTLLIGVHYIEEATEWYYNLVVTTPLFVTHIYYSEGQNRFMTIYALSNNFFAYHPVIRKQLYDLIPSNLYLRQIALVAGIYA
jgi:hypothetical protein